MTANVTAGAPPKGRRDATARPTVPSRSGAMAPHPSLNIVSDPSAGSAQRYVTCSSAVRVGLTTATAW